MKPIDLNSIADPQQVAALLRAAADAYRESAIQLEAAWQARSAGRPWSRIANILDRAAISCDRAMARE